MEKIDNVRNRQTGEYEDLCLLNGRQWVVRNPQTRRTRLFDDNAYERIAPSAPSTMLPPQRPLMPALTQPISSWGIGNMARNQSELLAAGLEEINRDRAGLSQQTPGYQLASYLLSNNLTYGLAAPRFGMSHGNEVKNAVTWGAVKSEHDKATFEQLGIYGFTIDRRRAGF